MFYPNNCIYSECASELNGMDMYQYLLIYNVVVRRGIQQDLVLLNLVKLPSFMFIVSLVFMYTICVCYTTI